jgi:hypothetical protein
MDRSRFLSILGTSVSLPLAGPREETAPMRNDIYSDLVKVSEQAAVESLPIQQADGGLRDEHEIPQPGAAALFLAPPVGLPPQRRTTLAGCLLVLDRFHPLRLCSSPPCVLRREGGMEVVPANPYGDWTGVESAGGSPQFASNIQCLAVGSFWPPTRPA